MGFGPTQSLAIRDAAFTRVFPLTINGVPMKTARKAPVTQVQLEQLPALGVFVLSEKDAQLGDVVQPEFKTTLELGLSWVCMASDEMLIDGSLDEFVAAAKTTLLCDTSFLEMYEFTEGMSREYVFSKQGEAYIAEIRLRMNLTYTTTYEAVAPYDFLLLDVQTAPQPGTPIIEIQIPQESQILNPPENIR